MQDLSYLYGIHAVRKFLQHRASSAIELIAIESRNPQLQSVLAQATAAQIDIRLENREQLTALVGGKQHQGCVLRIKVEPGRRHLETCLAELRQDALFLVLDGVQDPHNLGACLRSADATGVDAVIIPKDGSAKLTASVRKVAAGGAEWVPLIEVTNLARCLRTLKQAGISIYGTSTQANDDIYGFDYQGPVALVMGSENRGLRRLTREHCDHLMKLPMKGTVESLNISVAAGVCLYQILASRTAIAVGTDSLI